MTQELFPVDQITSVPPWQDRKVEAEVRLYPAKDTDRIGTQSIGMVGNNSEVWVVAVVRKIDEAVLAAWNHDTKREALVKYADVKVLRGKR